MSKMSPEDMLGIEDMVANIETLLNSFADASSRIKQRLIAEGWSQESAEAFAVATVGTMATGLMTQFTTPEPQMLEEIAMPPVPVIAFLFVALSAALVVTIILLLTWLIA